MSISFTTHCSASAAFLGFVMMGVIRCGTPAYEVSSTRFGSISTMRTSDGLACISRLVIIELTKLDLPEPVEPATRRCGIFARFARTYPPPTSLPTPIVIGWVGLLGGRRAQHVAEGDDLAVDVGDLDADRALAGDRGEDAHLVGGHRVGDVVLQRRDPLDLDPVADLDLVLRDRRSAREAGHPCVDLELMQHARDRARPRRRWRPSGPCAGVPAASELTEGRRYGDDRAHDGDRPRRARRARAARRHRAESPSRRRGCRSRPSSPRVRRPRGPRDR